MSWVWDAGIPFLQRVESIEKDLVYLNRELSLSETKIDELQKMVWAFTEHSFHETLHDMLIAATAS